MNKNKFVVALTICGLFLFGLGNANADSVNTAHVFVGDLKASRGGDIQVSVAVPGYTTILFADLNIFIDLDQADIKSISKALKNESNFFDTVTSKQYNIKLSKDVGVVTVSKPAEMRITFNVSTTGGDHPEMYSVMNIFVQRLRSDAYQVALTPQELQSFIALLDKAIVTYSDITTQQSALEDVTAKINQAF